ncbi:MULTISPECIES: hypothetical protein [unclassified Sphingobacterium]|uniref:hypothetical protein n=1 Tax=unclassified Sphingobacterium TaxID=2609468 RepID=UPI0025D8150E|nr:MULTISPECIES: hypothetical protein [unclassified Sphingobacterium]
MLYNPFEQVTQSSFRELVESGYVNFVLQRLELIVSDFSTSQWTFTTIYDPKVGEHPISGNRDFNFVSEIIDHYLMHSL